MSPTPRRLVLARLLKVLALAGGIVLAIPLAGFLADTIGPAPGAADRPPDAVAVPFDLLSPGEVVERRWRGRPVWLYRPHPGAAITVIHPFESLRGCKVFHVPPGAPGAPAGWAGGFGEPCFGARFDGRGRRVPGTGDPAQEDLAGPPHRVEGDRVIVGAAG